jgi:hypothetical protein
MSTAIRKPKTNAVENAPMRLKWYVTEDGVNLYDLFRAGIGFGQAHTKFRKDAGGSMWTEEEWYDALEGALPSDFVAKLDEQARQRRSK